MVPAPNYPEPDRRAFLAGVAGLAAASVVGRAADGTFEPSGHLPVDGLMEAVTDDPGEVVYGAASDGFVVVDVGDPADPRVLAERRDVLADVDGGPLEHVWDVKAAGDRLLVHGPAAFESLEAFALFDVGDPADPERIAHYETGHRTHNAFLDGDVVYLTGNDVRHSPVVVVDVSDDDPREVARFTPAEYGWSPTKIHDVSVHEDVLYACYWDLGTWLVDVRDPAGPTPIARLGFDADAGDTSSDGLPGNDHYAQPRPDGDVLAVGKEAFARGGDREGAPGGIELWDVSDPTEATRESILAPPDHDEIEGARTAHNFGWRGDRLYTSWYAGGVRVFEVGDPAEPRLLAGWRTNGTAFWTAEPIHEGFVGADHAGPMGDDPEGAGLYSFPEPTGDGDPAATMEPLAPAAVTTEFEASPAEATPTSGPGTTPTRTPESPADGTTSTPTDAPGFGVPAALAAGGLAGWRLLARRTEE